MPYVISTAGYSPAMLGRNLKDSSSLALLRNDMLCKIKFCQIVTYPSRLFNKIMLFFLSGVFP